MVRLFTSLELENYQQIKGIIGKQYQPSSSGGIAHRPKAAASTKSRMANRLFQYGQGHLERGQPQGYWVLQRTFTKYRPFKKQLNVYIAPSGVQKHFCTISGNRSISKTIWGIRFQ